MNASNQAQRTEGGPEEILLCLTAAREKLASILPPQADKLVRALQCVDLALQYLEIESSTDRVLSDLRHALRALNRIEKRDLPPTMALLISTTIGKVVRALRLAEARWVAADVVDKRPRDPNRRGRAANDRMVEVELNESDDTIELFTPGGHNQELGVPSPDDTATLPVCANGEQP